MVRPIYVPQAGRFVNFSDTASNDDIKAYIRTNFPKQEAMAPPAEPAPAPVAGPDQSTIAQRGIYGLLRNFTEIPGGIAGLMYPAEEAAQTAAGRWSAGNRAYLQKQLNIDPTKEPTTAQSLAEGLGSAVGFLIPGGAVAKGAGLLGAGARAAALTGSAAVAGQGAALNAATRSQIIEGQLASGMKISPETQLAAQRLDGLIGLSEALPMHKFFGPIGTLLSKVPASKAPLVEKIISSRLASLTKAGAQEAAQEAASGIASDLMEYGVYNPDVEIGQDVFTNAAGGAFAGSVIEGVIQLAAGRKLRGARQLQADLATEARVNDADARRLNISNAADELGKLDAKGILSVEENEGPDGSIRHTIFTAEKKPLVDMASADDAVSAINLYKKKTGADVEIDIREAPQLMPVRVGGARFQSIEEAAKEHEKIKSYVATLEKYAARPDLIKAEAEKRSVPVEGFKRQVEDSLKTQRKKLSMFDAYFSAEPVVSAAGTPEGGGVTVAAPAKAAEATTAPPVQAVAEPAPEVSPELTEEDFTAEIPTPEPIISEEQIPEMPIGAVELPIEESRILPDTIVDSESKPVEAIEPAPIRVEKRVKATAAEAVALQQELFGIHYNDMTPEQKAIYEAERDKRFGTEDVNVYYSAGRTNEPTPKNLREATVYGPVVRDYSPEQQQWMKDVYNKLMVRLRPIVPTETDVRLKTLVDSRPGYLIRGQADMIETPNGLKSIIDLSTGILEPDMTVDKAVEVLANTMNHEIIHVLRDNGLIRPAEWRILSRAVAKTNVPGKKYTYLDKAEAVYTPIGPDGVPKPISEVYESPDAVVEEAVAEMYREWVVNRNKPAEQSTVGILNRIAEFFRRIFQTLRNARHEDFFQSIESGEVARRSADAGARGVRYQAAPLVSARATPEERIAALRNSGWARYFESDRIEEIFRDVEDGKSRSTIVVMDPDDYLRMATHGLRNPGQEKIYAEKLDRGMKLNDFPMLRVKTYPNGETVVTGHEGRHRSAAFKILGMKKIPVVLRNETYAWGSGYGNAPSNTFTGQPPVEHTMDLPESIIFPKTERGTKDLNELLSQVGPKPTTSVSIGLAPDSEALAKSAEEAIREDDFYAGRKVTKKEVKEITPSLVPAGVARISRAIEEAAKSSGANKVYNTSGMGVYGGTAIEPSSAVEAIVSSEKAYAVANRMAEETFRIAREQKQSDAFVAVKVPKAEWAQPYARPGITLYFYNRSGGGRSARSIGEVKEIIASLPGADVVGGYTAIASERSTKGRVGLEEGYEAIRFIWIPEYAGTSLDGLVQNYAETLKAMNNIAKYAEENGIASASIEYYDVALASGDNYEKRIKEHGKLRASSKPQAAGRNGPWRRPVSQSVSERTGKGLARGADYSVNIQGTLKRFSAAPLPTYVEDQNKTLFNPAPKIRFRDTVFNYIFGHELPTKTIRVNGRDVEISSRTMKAVAAKAAAVDNAAYIAELEKIKNQEDTGNYQRQVADYSATAAIAWLRRASHVMASMMLRGNLSLDYATPGDILSATMKVTDDTDSLKEVFKIMTEPAGVNSSGEPQTKADIFKTYAVARRGEWLKATGQTVPRELTPRYIREAIDSTQQNYPEVVEAYNMYQRFNKKLMTTVRDAGLISNAELGRLTNEMNYYGFIYEAYGEPLGPTTGQKAASQFKLRPYTGTQHGGLVNDPMFVMIQNAQFMVTSIAKNLAAVKSFELAKEMGEARLLQTGESPNEFDGEQKDVMFFSRNGQVHRFAVRDPLMVTALGSDDRINVGRFWEVLGYPSHILRESVTRDPGFMARNLLRDTLSSWITSGVNFTPVVDTLKNFGKALKDSSSFQALGARGVVGSYDLAMQTPQELSATFKRNLPKNVHMVTSVEQASNAVRSLWNRLGHVSEASDAATRMAVYDALIKQGASEAEASMQAIELLDFTRRGASQTLGILTKLIPFLNARIQGMDVLYQAGRSGIRYATGKSLGERDANIGKKFLIRGGMLAVISMALEALNQDDEDYKQLDNYIKDGNLLIPLKEFGLKGQFIAYPKPFESGLLFSTFPQQIVKALNGDASTRDTANLFFGQLGATFGVNPIPQALLPPIEIITNHNFFTGLPLISEGKARLAPELQYNTSTSQLAMMIGGLPIFYDFTTGKFGGASPIVIDKIISGYGGPIGSYIAMGIGLGMQQVEVGPERMPVELSNAPVIRSFFIDAKSKNPRVVTQAYELFRIADEANRTVSRLKQMGDAEALIEYVDKNKDILTYKGYIFKLTDSLNKLSAQERSVERSTTMTADEKIAAQQKLRDIRIRLASNVEEINRKLGR